jgi:hypothetical protein
MLCYVLYGFVIVEYDGAYSVALHLVVQVFIGGKLIGGADETVALVETGEIHALLEAAVGVDPLPAELKAAVREVLAAEAAGPQQDPASAHTEGSE